MADLRCPMCGQPNPDHLEECLFCQARLHQPGEGAEPQEPGPVGSPDDWLQSLRPRNSEDLPDWLADFDGDPAEAAEEEQGEAPTSSQESPLEGFGDEPEEGEGDVPDWLKTLGPVEEDSADDPVLPGWLTEMSEPAGDQEESEDSLEKEETDSGLEPQAQREEDDDDFASTGEFDLPDWLDTAGAPSDQALDEEELPDEEDLSPAVEDVDSPTTSILDALGEELAEKADETPSEEDVLPEQADEEESVPDWLTDLEKVGQDPDEEDEEAPALPGWLSRLAEEEADDETPEDSLIGEETPEAFEADTADKASETPEPVSETDSPLEDADTPPWLSEFENLADDVEERMPGAEEVQPAEDDAWLAGFFTDSEEETVEEEDPDWLAGFVDDDEEAPSMEPAAELEPPEEEAAQEPVASDEVPDWLADALEQVEIDEMIVPAEESAEIDTPETDSADAAPPDSEERMAPELEAWLSNYPIDAEPEDEGPEEDAPDWLVEEEAPLTAEAANKEIPDWLQDLQERSVSEEGEIDPDDWRPADDLGEEEEESAPADPEPVSEESLELEALASGEGIEEDLSPGDIPDWLKAMRPGDEPFPDVTEQSRVEAGPVERVGPLAGMRGLLSAEPGASQAGKPPAQFVRLQITDLQQRKADQLQKMVQAETAPQESAQAPVLSEQKVLRYVIAAVLFLAALAPAFLSGRIAALPDKPQEMDLLNSMITGLSGESTVLVATDFQPGMAGEMDAASSAVFDHIMIQRPRLALVSTSAVGPALGERLVQFLEFRHNYTYGTEYVNLGYLPGDSTGLQAFASSPGSASTHGYDDTPLWGLLDRAGSDPWSRPALEGVSSLADFDLTVLVSDDPDTIRRWIEQVEPSLRPGSLVVIASDQAAPMVRPYFDPVDGPVSALVSGVRGGAAYEGFLQREGPARAAWDGFGLASLLAVVLVLAAGAYNLYLAWRIREDARAGRL